MRDRRNTNLSMSSTQSSSSDAPFSPAVRDSTSEKRYVDWMGEEEDLLSSPGAKENRPRSVFKGTVALKVVATVLAILLLLRCVLGFSPAQWFMPSEPENGAAWMTKLPGESTAVVVVDRSGHAKWTVSIPANATFPLPAQEYRDICTQSEGLRKRLNHGSKFSRPVDWRMQGTIFPSDPTYLDVAEAIADGVLPKETAIQEANVCKTSLTFSMETEDASFGKTLLMLWMSYGLAKKEGRAFFIDDSRWPYGKYSTYFAPPPLQDCTPPPPSHIVPCPQSARHIVVSAATAPWTFGPVFQHHFSSHGSHTRRPNYRILSQKANNDEIFSLLRTGYEALFHLTTDDSTYIQTRIAEIRAAASNTPVLTLQIRRGDLHPSEAEFSRDYLPFERYTSAAKSLLQTLSQKFPSESKDGKRPPLYLATDSPNLLSDPDLLLATTLATFQTLTPIQTRIQLATKAALDATAPSVPLREPGSAYVKHVDENAGWDGGFYAKMFYSLGTAGDATASSINAPSDQALRVRELVGRAYLLDLAVAGQASDGVVCAVGGAGCRVLGVVMGQEAVTEGRWRNVDAGRRGWSWDGR